MKVAGLCCSNGMVEVPGEASAVGTPREARPRVFALTCKKDRPGVYFALSRYFDRSSLSLFRSRIHVLLLSSAVPPRAMPAEVDPSLEIRQELKQHTHTRAPA